MADIVFSHFLRSPVLISRQELFVTFTRFTRAKNEALTLMAKLILKYIWDCKVRETLPNVECCKLNLLLELKCISKLNKNTAIKLAEADIDIETFL